jgi:hypothetical protein
MEPKEVNKNIANKLVNNGQSLREFKETQGFKIIHQWITDKVSDARDAWLKATPEQAESHRQKAAAYKELLDFVEHQIKVGDVYNDLLNNEAKTKENDYYA